jgi:choline dehydrogenase-like flavoprotein
VTKLALVRASPKVTDGSKAGDLTLEADVCIVGTGAGGAVTAAVLAAAGFDVLMLEEGGYYTSDDFTMRERDVTPRLYQEGGTRATK